MGTTKTAITTDSGVELCFVLMIEGYDTLITSHADTTAVVAAYQTTEWDKAVSGLHVPDEYTERMELFTGKMDIPGIRFVVSPDAADTFGKLVHKVTDPTGNETFLAENLTPETTPIAVDDITGFSNGDIWIGTECISFTGSSGGDLGTSTCYRGKWAPFKADSETEQRYGRNHTLTVIQGVSHKPKVTDYPRVWVGKVVRCMVHRVTEAEGSVVLDDFTEAETVFAGVLEAIGDSETGNTTLDCAHINKIVSDSLLLGDQYVGTVKPGVYLSAGDGTVGVDILDIAEYSYSGANEAVERLTTVSGAPANPNEITEGFYEYIELLDKLNAWIAWEFAGGRLSMLTTLDMVQENPGDPRTKIAASGPALGVGDQFDVALLGAHKFALFLGWPDAEAPPGCRTNFSTTPTGDATSPSSPLRSLAFQGSDAGTGDEPADLQYSRLTVVNPAGTWAVVPVTDVPDGFEASTGDWGFLKVGDIILQGRYDADNSRFTNLDLPDSAIGAFLGIDNKGQTKKDLELYGQTTINSSSDVEVRQVVILQNELAILLGKIFYSTGSEAYNAIASDVFPAQLGLGLPSELLGGTGRNDGSFFQALFDLQSVTESGDITIMLDKPTKFGDVLKPELLLRGGNVRFKGGKLGIGIAATPGATPEHTLTAANKAADADTTDAQRTRSNRTARLMRDKITVKYNRALDGEYRSDRTVVSAAALSDHGGYANPVTIKARNTVGGEQETNATVDAQLVELASYALGMFGHEVTEVGRSISRKHFHMSPGDTVALTDDSVRNPLTGLRGITAYPCWCEEVTRNWATGIGEAKLIMLGLFDPSRYGIYSPAAEVASYDTGTGIATVRENIYSLPADADDVTHFAAGDLVRFIEVSPSDPSAPSTWVDTIDSISSNAVTTVSNNGSGTYSAALTYVMVSDDRATAASTQQTDAYLADDADSRVQNAVESYLWAREPFTVNLSYGINTGSLHLTDASSQYIRITDANQTGMESLTKMSMAITARFDSHPHNENWLCTKWNTATGQRSFRWYYNSGSNLLYLEVDATAEGQRLHSVSWIPEFCRWYHLAVTFDGDANETKFYVDGVQMGATQTSIASDISGCTHEVRIGSSGNNSAYFDGDLDNFEFWNVVRTAAEIRDGRHHELYGNEAGLVCYLPLNNDLTDRTSNDNDFEAQNGAALTTEVPWTLGNQTYRYPADLADAEGEPVSVFHHTNMATNLNNLVSYKTAPQVCWAVGDTESSAWEYRYTSADSDVWRLVSVFPMATHPGTLAASDRFTRKLVVSPQFYRVSGSAAVSCRVTFMQVMPTGADWDDAVFREPYRQLEFSTSSTSPIITCPQSDEPPDWQGVTLVAVELKADNTEVAAFCGMPVCYLGPLSP